MTEKKQVPDSAFFKRADEHIDLSNKQITEDVNPGKVSASMMFSVARFNAWVTAAKSGNVIQMLDSKEDAIEYFVEEYRSMLEQNMDEYTENFDKYMGKRESE
jgi:hypothetical protein